MIWLASFPRSGNTFLRNILFEVYGLESSTFHREHAYPLDSEFDSYSFVKTHELPTNLDSEGFDSDIPSVYLVRDGRDALCSTAHHRADLIATGSDFYSNLREAIIAGKGSYFGGWSHNAQQWLSRADLIIRYEDLIREPLKTVERIGQLYELPRPDAFRLPTFESMKFGIPQYGAGRQQPISESKKLENAQKFFRKGKAGAWQEDMPAELEELFWSYHGETMVSLGYSRDGAILEPHPDLDGLLRRKLGYAAPQKQKKYKILMESDKLVSPDNDGVKRYQLELLRALYPIVDNPDSRWDIDLYFHGQIRPLRDFRQIIFQDFVAPAPNDADRTTPEFFHQPRLFLRMERALVATVPRSFVAKLQQHNITILHDVYKFFRAITVGVWDMAAALSSGVESWRRKIIRRIPKPEQAEGKKPEEEQYDAYDLVHIPLKQNFEAFKHDDKKKIITIHDMTHLHFPDHHTTVNIKNADRGMRFAESSGAHLIAVSKSTKRDILEESSVDPDKVHVIYEAADPVKFHYKDNKADCLLVRKKYGIGFDEPYIICLSTLEPRKNLTNSTKAFISMLEDDPGIQLKLVIAGKRGWDADGIYACATDHTDSVFFTDFVDDDDLAYLYSDALALSYLSFYEGFGLPPLEAMRCGTPVIYGNNSSLIEVVGKAGLPADPHDLADIKDQYRAIYKQPELRKKMGEAAIRQAIKFSWRDTAIQTLELYENVILGQS